MKNTELKDKIRDLEREIEYREKMFDVRVKGIMLEQKASRLDLEKKIEAEEIKNIQLIARMDEHPYRLVSDMLKALVVKFPTLNINDLAINSGKK